LYECCCRIFFHMRSIFSWFIYRIFKFFSYEFFWVNFLLFSKHFEYYRVLININLIILYFCKIYFFKIFLNNYRRNYIRFVSDEIFFLLAFFVSKSIGNNIFLLPTDLPTDKKLPTKDSPMETFRRWFRR
jgi:hypothetical protein